MVGYAAKNIGVRSSFDLGRLLCKHSVGMYIDKEMRKVYVSPTKRLMIADDFQIERLGFFLKTVRITALRERSPRPRITSFYQLSPSKFFQVT